MNYRIGDKVTWVFPTDGKCIKTGTVSRFTKNPEVIWVYFGDGELPISVEFLKL